jgi:hypothetical protein
MCVFVHSAHAPLPAMTTASHSSIIVPANLDFARVLQPDKADNSSSLSHVSPLVILLLAMERSSQTQDDCIKDDAAVHCSMA